MTAGPGGSVTVLRAGFGRADITPDWPIPLAGFASRDGLADGAAHPLSVRAAMLDTGQEPVLIVSADLLSWASELLPQLRAQIEEGLGVPGERILFAATHTHSAPQTSDRHAASIGVRDERFLDLLRRRLYDAATAARGSLEPVTVSRGTGRFELGTYRRKLVDGAVVATANPDGPRDPDVTVLTFRRNDKSLAGLVTHYTCHPVISADQRCSGDFVGAAMTLLESETGATSLYLQGCCGDINPGSLACAGLAEVDRQARALADVVLDVLDRPAAPREPVPLTVSWRRTDLPFDHVPTPAEITRAAEAGGVLGEWGRAYAAHPERIAGAARFEAQRLDIAADLSLLAMNGEVTVGYGLAIKRRSGGRVVAVGYAGGMIGYLPSAAQIGEGGYEAVDSARYYLLPGLYSPAIEGLIDQTTMALVDEVVDPAHPARRNVR